jgi:sugar phosphate isomerase/epimerase
MTRRNFLYSVAVPLAAGALPRAAKAALPLSKLGIASTSFVAAFQMRPAAGDTAGAATRRTTADFLEQCHSLGAGGIQAQINGDLPKLRARAEQLGMYVEGMISLPKTSDTSAFERTLQDAKAAGATVLRCAALSGRRYESFTDLSGWKNFVDVTQGALKHVVPILERNRMRLALENHKDWTVEDYLGLMKTYSSEYLGACLDFGNNISLLDDPMEVVRSLAPYTMAAHIKDMGVAPYEDGFLLSEVPLGEGLLDLLGIIKTVRRARPNVRFSLEMMTRDPLKVPCLTEKYWTVFPGRGGEYLARTLKLVQKYSSTHKPLPMVSQLSKEDRNRVEEENVKACLRYSREHLEAAL